mmetsp:Transcript_9383/g.20537  ORF Transcript_9383/g.20537 Transcript_9383/m.20537 type:complete len:320 (-) Transcript_9383:235-1194(-)|eukprot:CAMPEP_0204262992 /NCGR_PEP_ID=MMETSP0468-20130131/8036_1 /ASSEMBLY_ACC=CAM_ASM_000383 /TAXON_ID=2969 /ORGANISM="Oxyrrhis marina" /LENGTH=319 /DNA_ID=CAMNT_0051237705 /DNA_START=77 /DNA_END=1036 /DNA_ORIENTATION=-
MQKTGRKTPAKSLDIEQGQVEHPGDQSAKIFIGVSLLFMILWVVPMVVPLWQDKPFFTLVGKTFHFQTTLTHSHMDFSCGKHVLEKAMNHSKHEGGCAQMQSLGGKNSLKTLQDAVCQAQSFQVLNDSACSTITRLYWASMLMLLCIFIGWCFQTVAVGSFTYYWFSKRRERIGNQARLCYRLAPAAPIFGLIVYTMTTRDVSAMFVTSNIPGIGRLALSNASTNAFSWCYYGAWLIVVGMIGLAVSNDCCVGVHVAQYWGDEEIHGIGNLFAGFGEDAPLDKQEQPGYGAAWGPAMGGQWEGQYAAPQQQWSGGQQQW